MEFEVDFTVSQPSCEATFELTSGDRYFCYEQSVPSDEWTVTHNLGKKPSITVVDSADTVIIPDDEIYVDGDTVKIIFLAPFAGRAYLN